MKLKIIERTSTEKETDIDLPIYLYIQGEAWDDEYIKFDGEIKTVVTHEFNSMKVEKTVTPLFIEEYQLRNLTTEDVFNEAFENAIYFLTSAPKN